MRAESACRGRAGYMLFGLRSAKPCAAVGVCRGDGFASKLIAVGARGSSAIGAFSLESGSGELVVLYAGMCARRRTYFLLGRQKKVGKEKATPHPVSPALCAGATCDARSWGGAAELTSRCALRSDNGSESVHEAWACCAAHARPTPCASRHGLRGVEAYTGHRYAWPGLGWGRAQRRPERLPQPSGCAEERSGWSVRVRRRTHTHRDLTRRGCSSEARSAQRVPRRTPTASTAGCPGAPATGTQPVGSPFLCLLSFGEAKESRCAAGRTSRQTACPSERPLR